MFFKKVARPEKAGLKKAKKRMAGADRRAQIVRVATTLFSKNGFKGTTTREIARKAGISEAVIFKHFTKKEDLYKAIIDSRCADDLGQPRLMSRLKGKKGREVFTEVASYLIEEHQNDISFLRLLTYSALEKHDLSEMFIQTRGMELIAFLEAHIKELIEEGLFKKADPALAARAFMGMVLQYSYFQEICELKKIFKRANEEVVSAFVDIFFEGIRRR